MIRAGAGKLHGMARHSRLLFEGVIYHVIFRGVGRQRLFLNDSDYERLLRRLTEAVEMFGVRLYLYCLMGNHGVPVAEAWRVDTAGDCRNIGIEDGLGGQRADQAIQDRIDAAARLFSRTSSNRKAAGMLIADSRADPVRFMIRNAFSNKFD